MVSGILSLFAVVFLLAAWDKIMWQVKDSYQNARGVQIFIWMFLFALDLVALVLVNHS